MARTMPVTVERNLVYRDVDRQARCTVWPPSAPQPRAIVADSGAQNDRENYRHVSHSQHYEIP
jgi:hypothetical protein